MEQWNHRQCNDYFIDFNYFFKLSKCSAKYLSYYDFKCCLSVNLFEIFVAYNLLVFVAEHY